jgi:ParB-like chromosome segregation protein Spo0J
MSYIGLVAKRSAPGRIPVNISQKHIIHKAIEWKSMLDEGIVTSLNEIAKREGLSRARVTQVMNLLKLPVEVREFLARLDDLKEIRRYSERRLRNNLNMLLPNDSRGIQ